MDGWMSCCSQNISLITLYLLVSLFGLLFFSAFYLSESDFPEMFLVIKKCIQPNCFSYCIILYLKRIKVKCFLLQPVLSAINILGFLNSEVLIWPQPKCLFYYKCKNQSFFLHLHFLS